MITELVKSLETLKFLKVFFEVSYVQQGCIFVLKTTVKTIILWNSFAI